MPRSVPLALLAAAVVGGCAGSVTTGGGTPASLAISPASHAYGTVAVGGSSAAVGFTVANAGGEEASNVYVHLASGAHFTVLGNTCGTTGSRATIPAGGTCAFGVAFTPGSSGALADTVTVTYDTSATAGQTATAALSGSGEATAASLTFSPATHDFGSVTVGSSALRAFTVTNQGNGTATNAFLSLAGGPQFTVSGNGCGTSGARATIPAGGTCTFTVTFAPSAAGLQSGTLTITYDTTGATGQTATAALSGTGRVSSALLVFTPGGHAFGNVTVGSSSAPQGFVVANQGSAAATNVFLSAATGSAFAVSGNGCGTSASRVTVSAGGTCTFSVAFTPTGVGPQADTLTLTYDGPGAPGQTTTAALSGAGLSETTHGLSIPSTHPRLWYDADRLARARTWYASNPFTPGTPLEQATRGLLNNEAAQCRAAVTWASGASASMPRSGVACDECRWDGEAIILTYDWCHATMTPAERTTFISATNAWIDHWRRQSWGGPTMPENNYFWGYLRNELLWAITSYEDNVAMAETFLDDVFTTRLAGAFYPEAATGDMLGGVGREGSQYGIYIDSYASAPWTTSGLLGRDLLTESNFWRETTYALIYSTSPAPTSGSGTGQVPSMGYTVFPYNDDQFWLGGGQLNSTHPGNYMVAAAMRWADAAVGQHARQWLNVTAAIRSRHVQSVDPGGTALPFTVLPLDYYGPGSGMLYGRSAWGPSATTFHLKLKDGPETAHVHADWGTWQIWRNGRYVSRETVSYSDNITGYGGTGSVSAGLHIGHNSLLINGSGNGSLGISGLASVTRLESRPAYAYAATDLTLGSSNPAFVRWVREFVFVRGLETLVVLDRVESSTSGATKTFLAHCETNPTPAANGATCTNGNQALVMTTLVPSSPTVRVVAEGGSVGQYRIEVDTSPGTAQSYILTVLQAKDAGGPSLSPSVVDAGTTFTVTLNGSNSITFQKGMVSAGGSITAAGVTTPFTASVQGITVTDAGPAWQ